MLKRRSLIGLLMLAALAMQAGCAAPVQDTGGNDQKAVMDEFEQLLDDGTGLQEAIGFVNDNIAQMSKQNASIMVDRLEELQKENLPVLDEKFYSDQEIQSAMNEVYQPGFEMADADRVEHKGLRDLLVEARDTGYRVETAEGMYFPIIDYGFYQKYSDYVTDDLKEYIGIMAIESDEVPAKDAALVIGWDEVTGRALRQDEFLRDYPDSIKKDEIGDLYKKYVIFTLFGLNNTPLFDYNTKAMEQEAKDAFMQEADGSEEGGYTGLLKGYTEVLKENDYKLTDKVEEYRKEVSEDLQ